MITSFLKSFYQQPTCCYFVSKPIDHPLSLLHFDRAKRPDFMLLRPHKKIPEPAFPFQGFLDVNKKR
jgi:hypothetical protein